MSKPWIGLTTERWSSSIKYPNSRIMGQIDSYVHAVLNAGGIPILIPELPAEELHTVYARLDGLVLPGGGDVEPTRYQAEKHPRTADVDSERDRIEIALTHLALADGKPLFGVCRGAQIINVAAGGTLYQDLPSEYPNVLRHSFNMPEFELNHRAHPVQVVEESALARLVGLPVLEVNSRHHQAIRELAPGWEVAARAPDGVIEAIEKPSHPFALAVQWHPENLQDRPEMKALFERLVQVAQKKK